MLDSNTTKHSGASPSTFWEECHPLGTKGDGAPWPEPADTHELCIWKLIHIPLPCFTGTILN